MSTTIERNAAIPLGAELQRFQREVTRIVGDLVLTTKDGVKLCTLTAKTELHDDPIQAIRGVIISLVDQWAMMYNDTVNKSRSLHFGHLDTDSLEKMDVVHQTGIALFCALKELHEICETDNTISDKRLDLATALNSLKILRHSYDCNPANEDLVRLSA